MERASGRTTRLVDKYIQEYFSAKPGEIIKIIDHTQSQINNQILAKKIIQRLKNEHNINIEINYDQQGNIIIIK